MACRSNDSQGGKFVMLFERAILYFHANVRDYRFDLGTDQAEHMP